MPQSEWVEIQWRYLYSSPYFPWIQHVFPTCLLSIIRFYVLNVWTVQTIIQRSIYPARRFGSRCIYFLFITGIAFEFLRARSHFSAQIFIRGCGADAAWQKNPFCAAGRKEGEEALMKISADLSTFEIVLFKSTMACIHTYFIVHARRGNGNYLCGPRREGDKGKER